MPPDHPSPKLAITMAPDVHAQVLEAAARCGVSVSSWITDAPGLALKLRDGLAAVADWEAEHGGLTEAELKAARQRLAASGRPRRSTGRRRPGCDSV